MFEPFDQLAHIFTTTQHDTLIFLPIETGGLGLHTCIFFSVKLLIGDMFKVLSKLT